ncbi:hypothetical protein L7F22_022506 [Adiantum nelumboides]|nr:hypothetical protein [Adiantum nelumboides]
MTLRPAALQLALLLVALLPFSARAADDDPLQNLCVALSADELQQLQLPFNINGLPCRPAAAVNSSDFTSHQLRNPGIFTGSLGSSVNLATAATFGGLNTQGLSVARIDYNPRGINPPQVHPRATEVLFLAHGKLLVASSPPRPTTSSSTRPSMPAISSCSRVALTTSSLTPTSPSPHAPSPPLTARTPAPPSLLSPSSTPTYPSPRRCSRPPSASATMTCAASSLASKRSLHSPGPAACMKARFNL